MEQGNVVVSQERPPDRGPGQAPGPEGFECRGQDLPAAARTLAAQAGTAPTGCLAERRMRPHQRALRTGRDYTSQYPYSVTACTEGRRPALLEEKAADVIVDSVLFLREGGRIRLLGFVVMPDHVHLAFALKENQSLDRVMKSFKSYTGMRIGKILGVRPLWQEGYYDHALRDMKDFESRLNYMHDNPVRKGLAERRECYEYSTAHPRFSQLVDWAWVAAIKP